MHPVGILLAAGRGSRFDSTGAANKLLAPLPGGTTVAGTSARNLRHVIPHVIAVVRPGAFALAAELRAAGCDILECIDAEKGMAASLVTGIRASSPAPFGWIVALGDMPFVAPATIQALEDALADGASIAAPVFAGRRGNPVAFAPEHRDALLALHGDQGARALLEAHPVTLVPVEDPGVLRDVDLRSDLPSD
jgi:molybdenum cofactor cytidylyltransferase